MFSILIPTYNNIDYLKLCIASIKKNSKYNHQIIIHVNEGSDGTLEYVKSNRFEFTYSKKNAGMPKALNLASKLALSDYLVISHDDFYYCPGWDNEFHKELSIMKNNLFYLSGTMVNADENYRINKFSTLPTFDAGLTHDNFNEEKLLNNLHKIKYFNFQGTTKHPALIHKELWEKVGGWSEEFFPTGGDDTDFLVKLWNSGVRIFKGLGKCTVYHFGSITTRKKNKSLFTYLGSKANKIFIRKWSMSINFFENYYLRSGYINKRFIANEYDGPLLNPNKNYIFLLNKIKFKIYKIYLDFLNIK